MSTLTANKALTDALRTVAINGAYDASRVLSKWLRRGVRLRSEGFAGVPIAEASSVLGESDEAIVAIHLPLRGDLSGHILLVFPERVALSIVDIMMQVPDGTTTTLGELEQSCLQETGNIVGSSYCNCLAKWLKLEVEPDVPTFVHDMACSVIDPLLAESVQFRDEVFISQTDFLMDGQKMRWGMLLIPSEDSMRIMEKRCDTESLRQNALRTIAVNGAFNASRAMSKWIKRGVKLSTEGFSRTSLGDVASHLDDSTPVVAIHSVLTDHVHGHTLLIIPNDSARRLVSLLTGEPEDNSATMGELERSCLQETGNIIASSFVNSWATWLDVHLEPGAPQFAFDLPAAIIESVLAEQARVSDEVFMARTDFTVDDHWLEMFFLLLPAPSAARLIEAACQ